MATTPLAADPSSETGATIRQLRYHYDRKVKLPKSLVEELTRTSVRGQIAWQEARQNNDFATFRPLLEQTVRLKQQQAEAIDYEEHPYNALLDEYEQGEVASSLSRVLAGLREELVPLVAAIRSSGRQPDVSLLQRRYPSTAKRPLAAKLPAKSVSISSVDDSTWRLPVLHDAWPARLPHYHSLPGEILQLRLFRHLARGRSRHLRTRHAARPSRLAAGRSGLARHSRIAIAALGEPRRPQPGLLATLLSAGAADLSGSLAGCAARDFYYAINDVRPSLIRVEADEATYNLHILIRFELEQALLHDELDVEDLPTAWNTKYQAALGIVPPTDAKGVLQDIHWSAGLIGYFPTYSLGNLYASQFFAKADADLGGLAAQVRGEFALHEWLVQNIHREGQRYTAAH